jgi:hypothetical protein
MVMKRTSIGLIGTGEPLIRQALESIRKAHEAEPSGLPADEVLRLKLLTDSSCHCLSAWQS